jgi:hypothetical protein
VLHRELVEFAADPQRYRDVVLTFIQAGPSYLLRQPFFSKIFRINETVVSVIRTQ